MSTPMITCPSCGSPMPANVRFCPECGHTNTSYSAQPAAYGPTPAAPEQESAFATPMQPPQFYDPSTPDANAPADTTTAAASSDMAQPPPEMGAPTVNVGALGEQTQAQPQYTPPVPPAAWQPGQYGQYGPQQGGQVAQQPQQGQMQSQSGYAPPPQAEYNQPPGGYTQYGAQYPQSGPPPAYNYQYQSQSGVAGVTPRDPTIGLLLELLGYIGFLGIGHIYGGRVGRGIGLLVGWWVYLAMSAFLTIFLIGCFTLLIGLAAPILSGLWIRRELEQDNSRMRQRYM